MAECPNCNNAIPDYASCPYCEFAHQQLLERLGEQENGMVTIAVVAGWAVHGYSEQPERAWRIG